MCINQEIVYLPGYLVHKQVVLYLLSVLVDIRSVHELGTE